MRMFSLKTKMSIVVSLLVTVLMVALAFLIISRFEKRFRETVASQQFTLVNEMVENIDTTIERTQNALVAAAKSIPSYAVKDAKLAQMVLENRPGLLATFDNGLHLFSSTGRMIAETPDLHRQGSDYSHREYFRKTMESGKPHISAPFLSSHGQHNPSVMFTAPLFDDNGKIVAILGGNIDLTKDNILGDHARVKIGKSGYVYIYSTDRTIIMHPDRSRILKQDVPPGVNLVFDKGIAGFNGTEETVNSRGLKSLTTVLRFKTTNWIMGANYPMEEAYAPIKDATRFSIVAVVAGILASLLVVWLSMKSLTAPLGRLTGHIRRIAERDGEGKDILIDSRDEIGELATAFNNTMRSLDRKQEELRMYSEELESAKLIAEAQRARSEAFIAGISDPISIHDLDFRIIYQNRFNKEKMGDHLGEHCFRAYHGKDSPCDGCIMIEAFQDGDVHCAEREAHHSFGSNRYQEFTVSPVRDAQGRVVAAIELIRDITERRQAEVRRDTQLAVSAILTDSPNLEEAISQVLEVVCTAIGWDLGGIWWVDKQEKVLRLVNSWYSPAVDGAGYVEASRAFTFSPGIGLPGRVWASQEVDWIEDLTEDDNYPRKPFAAVSGLRSAFAFPITLGGRTIGVLEVYSLHVKKLDTFLQREMIPLGSHLGQLLVRKQAEESLRDSERRFREVLENIRLIAIELDRDGKISFCNDYLLVLTGWKREEVYGNSWFDYFVPSGTDQHEIYTTWISSGTVPTNHENEILTRSGEHRLVSWNITGIYATDWTLKGISFIGEDITIRRDTEDKLRHISTHDMLTGLYNRSYFDVEMNRLMGGRQFPVSVIMADLDGLKSVNDTLGHAAGDRLIQAAARVLLEAFRNEDVVARIGGDEFAVLLPATNEQASDKAIQRVRSFQNAANATDDGLLLSISLGAATAYSGEELVTALRWSDERMYQDKSVRKERLTSGRSAVSLEMMSTNE